MFLTLRQRRSTVGPNLHGEVRDVSRGHYSRQSGLASGRAGRSCGNNSRRLLAPGSRFSFGSVHLLSVVAHEIATLPQWPRINPRRWSHSANASFARHSEYRPRRRAVVGVAAHVTTPLRSLVTWAASLDAGSESTKDAADYSTVIISLTATTTTVRSRSARSCRRPGIASPVSSGSRAGTAGSPRPPARPPTRR